MAKRHGNLSANSQKLAELRAALASDDDPLGRFREAMPEGSPEQNVVVYVFSALLDTNSEGLPILLDRFGADELEKICVGLQSIGATNTLADLLELRRAFADALKSGMNPFEASEQIAKSEIGRALTKKYETHAAEMENKLLKYCWENIEILAQE